MKNILQKKFKSPAHEIINKFLNTEDRKDKHFWPKEVRLAKKLLSNFPIEFFRECKNPLKNDAKIPSLAWFLSENGKKFLKSEFFEFQKKNINLNNKEEIILSETKIGEDIQITFKPKTFQEFLKYYGKKN